MGTQLEGTDYELVRELATGPIGSTWLGRHAGLGRQCVLKFVHPELAWDPEFQARASREARALAKVRHPGVVQVFDFRELPDGRQVLAIEHVEGETLETVLSRGRLSIGTSLRLVASALDGLEAVHQACLLHRDLKPANIIVLPSGTEAKLIDFGLTKHLGPPTDGVLTEAGEFVGTPEYASPEQAAGQPLTPQSDIFSMGVVLFECLTGRRPFDVSDRRILQRLGAKLPPPELVADGAPAHLQLLQVVVRRALRSDPGGRFASAAAFAEAVRGALAGQRDPDALLGQPKVDDGVSTDGADSSSDGAFAPDASVPTSHASKSRTPIEASASLVLPQPLAATHRLGFAVCGIALAMTVGVALGIGYEQNRSRPQGPARIGAEVALAAHKASSRWEAAAVVGRRVPTSRVLGPALSSADLAGAAAAGTRGSRPSCPTPSVQVVVVPVPSAKRANPLIPELFE